MRIESTGNLTLDAIRHRHEAATQLIAFAPPHVCDAPGKGHACVREEPRAIEDVCDASVARPDHTDRETDAGFVGPTAGWGYGEVEDTTEDNENNIQEISDSNENQESHAVGWVDMASGGMLDVFA